jgi:splicing factor 3A subunit 1
MQIDWHSFVVVETVDYQSWEVGNFPPPTNPTEVGARVLIQRRAETTPVTPGGKSKTDKEEGERSGANLQVGGIKDA